MSNRINIAQNTFSDILEYDYLNVRNLSTPQIVSFEVINLIKEIRRIMCGSFLKSVYEKSTQPGAKFILKLTVTEGIIKKEILLLYL